jgi:hypothetical protein
MGNQMFQYVAGKRLAKELGTNVKFDLSALLDRSRGPEFVYRDFDLDIFDVEMDFTHSPKLLKFLSKLKSNSITKLFREQVKRGKKYKVEEGFSYQSKMVDNPTDNTVYEGWFQSYKYIKGIEEEIKKHFRFKYPLIDASKQLCNEIALCNAVCLNVRRTDFVENANLNVTNLAYFLKGVDLIASKVGEPHFYVFSDDVKWCEENIELPFPTQIVDHSHKGYKFGNYLQLMSKCKHFVIPNSSFAWWAAWLSQSENKIVVTPKNWFNDSNIDTSDLIPPTWIRIK